MKHLDLPIYWETPSNMTISMSNRKMTSKQFKTNLIKKAKPISILVPTDQIDYRHIKTGFMPNFIHSLDASNIHLLIKNIEEVKLNNINLYTIHDCFASDCYNIAIIELLVKYSFIQLYFQKDYLEFVHNSFLKQIESYTQIFEEENTSNKYIYVPKKDTQKSTKHKMIYIPKMPEYKWSMTNEFINNNIIFNSYFIS